MKNIVFATSLMILGALPSFAGEFEGQPGTADLVGTWEAIVSNGYARLGIDEKGHGTLVDCMAGMDLPLLSAYTIKEISTVNDPFHFLISFTDPPEYAGGPINMASPPTFKAILWHDSSLLVFDERLDELGKNTAPIFSFVRAETFTKLKNLSIKVAKELETKE